MPGDAAKEMATLDNWEGTCRQCGLCCFEKIEDERGRIFFTQTPCRYLDLSTRRCKIYERRFEINPECIKLTPFLVRDLRWLHDECGYVQALGREKPGREETEKETRKRK